VRISGRGRTAWEQRGLELLQAPLALPEQQALKFRMQEGGQVPLRALQARFCRDHGWVRGCGRRLCVKQQAVGARQEAGRVLGLHTVERGGGKGGGR